MKLFSIADDHTVLCDTPLCFAEIRRLAANTPVTAHTSSPAEVVLCVLDGEVHVDVEGAETQFVLGPMDGIQIPAGQDWRGQTGAPWG